MTDFAPEISIRIYQREQKELRNRRLRLSLRRLDTAEQFFFALRSLVGLNTTEREAMASAEFSQTLA